MIEKTRYENLKNKLRIKSPYDLLFIFVLNVLISIPTFIIAHQNLINLNFFWHIDRIILALLILILIQYVLYKMRKVTFISVFLYFLVLIYSSIFGNYGFKKVSDDYKAMLFSMNDNPFPQDILIDKMLPFPNKSKILSAIDFENTKVRNFALMATTKYFKNIRGYQEQKTIIQCFAVFKEINSNWNYVNDPKNQEYIASASESIKYLSGDCDDHSILMAACIRAIGGTPRLIHTDGHIYPEILIGKKSDLEIVNFLIKKVLFENESKKKPINYHIDERGQVWMNLDYTAKYPGGPFMSDEILGALTLE